MSPAHTTASPNRLLVISHGGLPLCFTGTDSIDLQDLTEGALAFKCIDKSTNYYNSPLTFAFSFPRQAVWVYCCQICNNCEATIRCLRTVC